MRGVIFDLDGTLMDTSGDLIAAVNSRFRALGLGDLLDPVADAAIAVRGGRMMLRTGFGRVGEFTEEDVDREFPLFVEAYDAQIDVHSTIFPGAMEAVEALKTAGYAVGICTNKPEAQAIKLLKSFGILDAFGSMLGADTLPIRKPDPEHFFETARRAGADPARSCLVGDSDTDRNTARNAGVPSILVTFGPSGPGMPALEPEALLPDFSQLLDIVEGLSL